MKVMKDMQNMHNNAPPCRENPYQSNRGGIIKSPKPAERQPKASVVKGSDLRNGKK